VINSLTKKKELWLAYSATLNKFFESKESISAPRRKRISGKSKMSYSNLITHSLNIQSVYMKNIFFSYIIYSTILIFLFILKMFNIITLLLITLLITHFLIITFNIKKEKKGITFNLSLNNIKSIKKI
jgi:hypothetical protein